MKNNKKLLLFVFFLELGPGFANNYYNLPGSNPLLIGRFGYISEDRNWKIEYQHQSSIPDGEPVNKNRDWREQESINILYHKEF